MLYPRETTNREVKDLSGIWEFKIDKKNEGFKNKWYEFPIKNTILMPVPASYNDITQDIKVREHIGDVWYERTFFVPKSWQDKRVVIRVGSATHFGTVWVNGKKVMQHKGGYLPFEIEIGDIVDYDKENRLTIAVNNVLDWTTLPPGEVEEYNNENYPDGYKVQKYFHDFYNYAGIHRPVKVYCTPKTYIDDVSVVTDISDNESGIITYDISVKGKKRDIKVYIMDEEGKQVASGVGESGKFIIDNAHLWEPGNPYLYKMIVKTFDENANIEDSYWLDIGIRTVKVQGKQFLINGKPFYFKGFGKHEDSDIRGKALDNVINIKDFNLMKWIGANSFRTSHYPYSEEILQLADKEGIVVIDESPAVGMTFFNSSDKVFVKEHIGEEALKHHLEVMEELINRDKNHPCVVMWSVANEPSSWEEGAVPYFEKVVKKTRKLDSTRPVTLVNYASYKGERQCKVAQMFDVVCINKYFSWYEDCGRLEVIEHQLQKELNGWYDKFQKPIIISEFGADTIEGFHSDPPVMFTEEYQCEMLKRYNNVFDKTDFVIGEHVWNFADFATKQGTTRIIGNRKGVFTRQRQPKMAAHMLRKRWLKKENHK